MFSGELVSAERELRLADDAMSRQHRGNVFGPELDVGKCAKTSASEREPLGS